MLWSFIGAIGGQRMQRTPTPGAREAEIVSVQERAKASPAFDEWLQAYRERLEEACRRATPRPPSPANASR